MFSDALAAKIPILGVTTDDLPNLTASLQLIAGLPVRQWPTLKSAQKNLAPVIYWTDDLDQVTVDTYRLLSESEHQLVVINPEKRSPLVFDAGELPTPPSLIEDYLKHFVGSMYMPALLDVLKGLSLKTASEIVQLTMVRTGSALPQAVRYTRTLIGGQVKGLYPVDTGYDFYAMPKQIAGWLALNEKYFLNPLTPPKLMPRGLMLAGPPGTGKSQGSKAIARHFEVPLYRLDIATTLDRFLGESESRVARSLSMLEKNAPCILLLDEVEKVFDDQSDSGVTRRILAQMLWWLAEHRAKVLTIMTTNDLKAIPPELYRPGRIDRVVEIPKLSLPNAKAFALEVFKSVIGKSPTVKQVSVLHAAIDAAKCLDMAHVEAAEICYETVKAEGYFQMQSIANNA